MSGKIDAATTRRCRACHEVKPLTRFRFIAELRKANRTCNECRNHTPGPTAADMKDDPYLDAPRPCVRLREGLPPLGTRDLCSRCGREWVINTRCLGYHLADCGEYVPHYHRRCLTCAQEILEADPSRADTKVVDPLPIITAFLSHDMKIPALAVAPEGQAPDFAKRPFYLHHRINVRFAAIARQIVGKA